MIFITYERINKYSEMMGGVETENRQVLVMLECAE